MTPLLPASTRTLQAAGLLLCTVLVPTLPSGAAHGQAPASTAAGAVSLFDGRSLDGWEGKPEFWSVRDGAIVGETTPDKPTKGNTFLVWRDGTVGDCEITFRYRITGGNSGVQYRSTESPDFVVGGYQADIDSGPTFSGIVYEERGRGILANRGERITIASDGTKTAGKRIGDAAELQRGVKPGEWNEYRIVADGTKFAHYINGQLMVELDDAEEGKRAAEGVLALQLHAGPPMKVEFRDITLRRLGVD